MCTSFTPFELSFIPNKLKVVLVEDGINTFKNKMSNLNPFFNRLTIYIELFLRHLQKQLFLHRIIFSQSVLVDF